MLLQGQGSLFAKSGTRPGNFGKGFINVEKIRLKVQLGLAVALQHRSVPVAFHLLSCPELSFLPDFNFCLPDGCDRSVRLIGDFPVQRNRRDSAGRIGGGKVSVRLGLPFGLVQELPLQDPVRQVSNPCLD